MHGVQLASDQEITSDLRRLRFCVEQNMEPVGSLMKILKMRHILASTSSHGGGPVSTSRTASTLRASRWSVHWLAYE